MHKDRDSRIGPEVINPEPAVQPKWQAVGFLVEVKTQSERLVTYGRFNMQSL
jgi:hypothetical protein